MPSPKNPSRRRFLAAAGAVVSSAVLGDRSARDPRLTARPRRPFRDPDLGLSRLGPTLPRGAALYVPPRYDPDSPTPLVVALHGGGGSIDRWLQWSDLADERGFILLAPEARERTWDRVGGAFGPDVRFIDSALRYTFERCSVDPRRIALLGFSDGASYALSLGPSNGDLFTHLIAFSPGFSAPEDPIVGAPRVFVSHGTADRILPYVGARDGIVPMFEMDGYATRFRSFEGGHTMPDDVVAEALDWFLG